GGSAEIFGAEIPPERPIRLTATKVAIFTWHGCTLDVSDEDKLDIVYVSEETDANVAYVNTHAQLEAMRDEALAALLPATNPQQGMLSDNKNDGDNDNSDVEGPRVLLVGPADCGKSSLARVLSSYAVKLGRTPLLVDLDASQNMLSVPGTMAVCPISADGISAESNGTASLMMSGGGGSNNAVMPFAQLEKMGKTIDGRLSGDVDARASGVIVNASGLIEDVGYTYLLHAIDAFRINVVVVLGHDRLYSMLGTHFKKQAQQQQQQNEDTTTTEVVKVTKQPKLIKLPVAEESFRGTQHSDITPSLIEVPFADVQLHQLSNISLSASMLPVSAKQSTDPIQLNTLSSSDITPKLQHAVFAVCHPSAVEKYEQSGRARDLYLSGVAGFVAVEKVDVNKEVLSLLSPCAGSLPSQHLLVGDNITWVE
ncbi:pre-mRNA cleavage complex II protein Clp1, partial [Skeletonema marinoi]